MVVGASNRLPEDDALAALFDRFLLRVHCDNVGDERLGEVLSAGWKLGLDRSERESGIAVEDIRKLQAALGDVDLAPVRSAYIELVRRLRRAGIAVSDRRAVKLQRLIAASSLLCGRAAANRSDLWVLRYIWDTQEQQEVVATVVQEAIAQADDAEMAASHPMARGGEMPNAEELARELERLQQQLADTVSTAERAVLRDQLSLLAGRCAWVVDAQARTFLEAQTANMWKQLELAS
jgi:MoxR-like ATPase